MKDYNIKPAGEVSMSGKMRCFIISAIGILLFFVPMNIMGMEGVGISILSDILEGIFEAYSAYILLVLVIASMVLTIIAKIFKPEFMEKHSHIKSTFNVNSLELIIRIVATVITIMVVFGIGPEFIKGDDTGGEMVGLSFSVMVLLFLAAYLLPTILDFGLMDFVGILATKVMRPLFRLPGKAALDTIASWVGSGSVGVMISAQEYENGGYTKREASVIATTFSVTSISYAVFMVGYVGMANMFLQFYGTCILAGIVCALIMPRIRPLSKIQDTYYNTDKVRDESSEALPEGTSLLKWAYLKAINRGETAQNLKFYINKGNKGLLNFWFGLIPTVIAVGTIGLALVNNTPIFDYIAYPFKLILSAMQVPDAGQAAPAMIVGFIDFFIPLPIANQIESLATRFIIVCMALIQIIYLTQTGALMMKSKLDIKLGTLFIIFLERTIISLPIIVIIAHLIF